MRPGASPHQVQQAVGGAIASRNFNMERSLAEQDRAITIPASKLALGFDEPPVPISKPASGRRRRTSASGRASVSKPRKSRGSTGVASSDFYRDLVWNLRNGVLAITRDGRVAVMNDVAYRILGLSLIHI